MAVTRKKLQLSCEVSGVVETPDLPESPVAAFFAPRVSGHVVPVSFPEAWLAGRDQFYTP